MIRKLLATVLATVMATSFMVGCGSSGGGNAMPELKVHAKFITDTNNNSGVAKAINKLVL